MPAGASEAQQAPSFPDTAAPLLLVCGAAFGAMSLEAAREEACALRGPGDALPCAKAMVAAVTNGRSAGEVVEQALYIEPGSPIDELLVLGVVGVVALPVLLGGDEGGQVGVLAPPSYGSLSIPIDPIGIHRST